jgi:hypothetical protein
MIAQVDKFHLHIATRLDLLQDPSCRGIGKPGGTGRTDDDGDAGF